MNPTDKVDDLLAKAGAQWRATQPSAPEPDLDRITSTRQKRRWLIPTLAAASVAAIATAALIVLPDRQEPAVAPAPSSPKLAEGPVVTGVPSTDNLLVRNGDKVRVNGQVIAVPGQQPVYCATVPTTLQAIAPGKEPTPSCAPQYSVKLIGLDLGRLRDAKIIKGVRVGRITLTGAWQDRTVTVEKYLPALLPSTRLPGHRLIPCDPPSGGWSSRPSNISAPAVQAFLAAHADQVSSPVLATAAGKTRPLPVVAVIGVAQGGLETFRTEFSKVYQGNLCLFPAKLSLTESQKISDGLAALTTTHKDLGIYATGGQGVDTDRIPVSLLVYDEKVKQALAPIGTEYLDLDADIERVP